FFDAMLVGDGEEAILEMAEQVRRWRQAGGSREELQGALEAIAGVYVPARFEPVYDGDGALREIRALGAREKVHRRVLADLNDAPRPPRPLVPQVQIVHDRLNVEIARGCTRGCRFCQAGMIYRPVRERQPEAVLAWIEAALAASGFEEVSLLSLSTGDYSCLPPLLRALMDRLTPQRIALSLPSMRADTLQPDLMEQIRRVRKTGFTIAPEAGSERLRQAINKNLSEAEILTTVQRAFEAGWQVLKMYFMIGFPMEERADLEALADLCHRALQTARGISAKARLHVSINTFIPKPHTPFQWERQLSRAASQERLHLCKDLLRHKYIEIRWNPSGQSWLEGILSRGDRRLAPVLLRAQQLGCRFDAWTEHCRLDLWQTALTEQGLAADDYLRERREEEILPWEHIDLGVSRAYLLAERRRAWEGIQTPDCRHVGCLDCGVCDWQTVQPHLSQEPGCQVSMAGQTTAAPLQVSRYRLHYSKQGEAKWLSHLEFMQVFYRSLRRAGLPLHFSQGFHPLPRVSVHGALPV
ncbi:MAG: TIGR03960 family B12-binding radical SAM protein, partial [Desulfobacca sp.]|uniref:TIGR03960 family B12-binding radical SAM protein n=1 Tax=Desulfobacca sp. TaxID=2067990 RepID=UPI00404B5D68